MSESQLGLRRKIESCNDLHAVVRTMKALAAANIGQYELAVLALADYRRAVELGLGSCMRRIGPDPSGATGEWSRGAAATGAIVFGSDQGLVGQFNEVVVEYAVAEMAKQPHKVRVWAVGERAAARLADLGVAPVELLAVPHAIHGILPLVAQILACSEALNSKGELSALHLYYNTPVARATFAPVGQRLLPLDEDWLRQIVQVPWPTAQIEQVLGDGITSLRAFVREFLLISLFRACVDSLASENASRLSSMERADKNISELLDELKVAFHRIRQARIDEELFDVVAGFEALVVEASVRPAGGAAS